MRRLYVIFLINGLFICSLTSQTLIQQIEEIYSKLDSVSYIENVILSYKENWSCFPKYDVQIYPKLI
ncbi:MAG: hypothetical protein Q4A09_09490, partial [Capnocytophaga felis]|nr:hypothetical protein [Capnocytophaga felis]